MSTNVVIFTDAYGWHEKQLVEAFGEFGVEPTLVSLANCGFSEESNFGSLSIPQCHDRLPHAVFVRGISAGSFEQVTLRLDVLHALLELSVRVVNSARVIEKTVDKAMTSHLLKHADVATVPAWTTESRNQACRLIQKKQKEMKKLVLKPLFGSRGRGLKLIESEVDIPDEEAVNGVYYLQEFVLSKGDLWHDWRIMVVRGQAISAMERRSTQWITNRSQGAECKPAQLSREVLELAEGAADAVGAAYAGVDVIQDRQGQWKVLEINGVPAWRGLQEVSDVKIAKKFAELVLDG